MGARACASLRHDRRNLLAGASKRTGSRPAPGPLRPYDPYSATTGVPEGGVFFETLSEGTRQRLRDSRRGSGFAGVSEGAQAVPSAQPRPALAGYAGEQGRGGRRQALERRGSCRYSLKGAAAFSFLAPNNALKRAPPVDLR